ncbi:PREDICTED: uncharacterized protein LOC105957362 [Erythranthe guttata]|uniref:uncharacterized protein LOC105957362 n=1 Tax=Erythranthe guttata TaxID=4155 RepID=UPI00064D7756|nr:PREDICTED: uncharacterized protein LOC105957362 [Erythranthe guttata]|eukprot:XP_012836741.1 PREDICTED: uncharacterized protein LOC105957362 [Erythranthe guttata]
MHCLFYCSLSRQIWAMSDVPRSSYLTTTTDMNEWMREIRTNSETIIVEKCVLLCWQIWNARNKKIFEGDVPNAMDIANLSKKLWSEIHEATIEVLRPRIQRTNEDGRWLPPNHDEVKLNFDAAVNNVDGVCSLGVIARSSTGACLGWISRRIKQYLDPTSAEAKAGLMAMEMAKIHNWENIILEGDSLVVISAIKDASSSRAEYGNIIADIQRLGASLLKFRAQHVRRNGNKAAHAIAALSKKKSNFVRELPDVVLDIVSSDMSE